MVSATDHLGYSPLLPEVAAGRLDPQRIAVPLHGTLGCSRIWQGRVEDVDFEGRKVRVACGGELSLLPYDRLVLATGSVTREVATPGLSEFAFWLKTLAEGQFVHDHVLRQLQLADTATDPPVRARAHRHRRGRGRVLRRAVGRGANDVPANVFHMPLYTVTWIARVLVIAGPVAAYLITRRICLGLQRRDAETLERGVETGIIHQLPDGGFTKATRPVTDEERAVLAARPMHGALPAPDANGCPRQAARAC